MKVMTIVGTRPEVIKLSRVIAELDRQLQQILVHTGQNSDFELNEIFFRELKIRNPDYSLHTAAATPVATIGNILTQCDKIMEEEKPDAVLLLGDTNSCLAAIPAKRRKIPIFHMEAGNRSFDQRIPEETNRKVIDHLSDINLPYTEHARRYLIDEGLPPNMIIKTGSPMKEIVAHYLPQCAASDVLDRLNLKPNNFFIVSSHREENVDNEVNFGDFLNSLNAIATKFKMPVVVSTHPRTRRRLEKNGRTDIPALIQFAKPFGFFDYVKLQMNARCVVSDSGTITEEASILNFPAITIRQAHERPEGMDEGTLIMSGLKAENVVKAIETVISQHANGERRFRLPPDYDVENVSSKVVRIILSYTDYVNRIVWRK